MKVSHLCRALLCALCVQPVLAEEAPAEPPVDMEIIELLGEIGGEPGDLDLAMPAKGPDQAKTPQNVEREP